MGSSEFYPRLQFKKGLKVIILQQMYSVPKNIVVTQNP